MREEIIRVLSQVLGIPPASIGDDASVETVEAWDSLRQIRLMMALEEKFQVRFDDEEVSDLISVSAIYDALRRHKNGVAL